MTQDQINKETIQRIHALEHELQCFWGVRHLWAELVANHKPCGVPKEKLEEQQRDRLTQALGIAHLLAEDLGLTWVPRKKE